MIVLGLDTSTSASAAALLLDDGRSREARDDPPPGTHPGHATRLLDLARGLLAATGVAWGELDRIAVGVGPGTFTGLRVGIATARGLAQSLSLPLVGVSSLAVLAEGALAEDGERDPPQGELDRPSGVIAVIDARRGEAFAAAFAPSEVAGKAASATGRARTGDRGPTGAAPGGPRRLSEPAPLAPAELGALARSLGGGADRGAARWLAVGDGAVRYRAELEAAGVVVPEDSSALHRVSAVVVCRGAARSTASAAETVVPDYRRRPDAELALGGARGGRP